MARAKKLDVLREHREEYVATEDPRVVEVAPARYFALEGKGPPGGAAFEGSVDALHAVAQVVRMAKSRGGRDFKIPVLEALYWARHRGRDVAAELPEDLSWKLLLRAPPFITEKDLHEAIAARDRKGKTGAKKVRLETIEEGTCIQALHIGTYETERETLGRIEEWVRSEGLVLRGLHHEIYLSDPKRVAPERLQTILRHPVGPERTRGRGLNRPARVLAWRELRPGAR